MRRIWTAAAIGAMWLAGTATAAGPLTLWYEKPAKEWVEALPLGNGRVGAMVFGGIEQERLQLNEDTLWSGVPHDYATEDVSSHVAEIRQRMFAGDIGGASGLADRWLLGKPRLQQAYQPLGDLKLSFPGQGGATEYRRELDLREGIARVRYRVGDATFTRECFISRPDQVLVLRLTCDKPGAIHFEAALDSPHEHTLKRDADNRLLLQGQWIGDGKTRDLQAGVKGPGTRFECALQAQADGGSVDVTDKTLSVKGANSVTLLLAAATSFRNYTDISGDPAALWRKQITAAAGKTAAQLREAHVADFRGLMDRVHCDFGGDAAAEQPTDKRLAEVRRDKEDPDLCALYFQFGRYLMVSSSRPGGQPANLQGLWNQDMVPAWGSKWTTNINTEMNYWPVEVCNLSECHEPLFGLMDDLTVTGGRAAKMLWGCRGWVLHHNTDLWRGAAPIDGTWGIWPMGGAWLARDPWEHYLFTQDKTFLRDRGWPLMKGSARFMLDFLVEAPAGTPYAGKLVTCPSTSPENWFKGPKGGVHVLSYATSMDLWIIRDLFTNCLAAIDTLDEGKGTFEPEMRKEIAGALERLAMPQINAKDGRLQEWAEPYVENELGHRHMSHLYGLHPAALVTPRGTPEMTAAMRKSLEFRLSHGGGGTGWSRAWLVNFFARLEDGKEAYSHVQQLLAKSTLNNLFDSCPPFQIDGNFGGTAGIAEMLLQSHAGEISLLPALPPAWATGRVQGLRARGGYTVDISWKDGKLTAVTLKNPAAGKCQLRCGEKVVQLETKAGEAVTLKGDLSR